MNTTYTNVAEGWGLYDTLCICGTNYGQESAQGFFRSFVNFAGRETHSFFKQRTEGNIGLAYTNKQSADSMDWPYTIYSIGCRFFSPVTKNLGSVVEGGWTEWESSIAHWWEAEMPRHCALQFKVNEDIILEAPCMALPSGYGPVNGGTSYEHENVYEDQATEVYGPVSNVVTNQGVPELTNRFKFTSHPIEVAKMNTIEAILHVSTYARNILLNSAGPLSYVFKNSEGGLDSFYSRFGIQISLMGKRSVQQRGQYHR